MPTIFERLRGVLSRETYILNFAPEENPQAAGMDARTLYATQANLYAVVSFLADNIAQLPLKVYTREGENDRRRDRDSVAAQLLARPNADQTTTEFVKGWAIEFLLMGVATVWLQPDADSESGYQIRLIPKEWIRETKSRTNYAPDVLLVKSSANGDTLEIPRTEFVQYRMYSPGNPGGYQSPIAALRQTLNEQIQADRFRAQVWRSGGRFNAYITRPKDVAPWDDKGREKWIKTFREAWGEGGANVGKMPLLEDGMEIKPYQFNAKEAQYAEARQLSREDVAAAYHVNPSLIWHTTTQTYASAKDNARALYADCLGPILQIFQQRTNAFLLPLVDAAPNTYVEFDLAEKLKGDPTDRIANLVSAAGGPILLRDEARSDLNLPPLPDGAGSRIITPLNVQAASTETEEKAAEPMTKDAPPKEPTKEPEPDLRIKGKSSEDEDKAIADVMKRFFVRQAKSVLPKLGAKSEAWWDEERWDAELADDLEPEIVKIADKHGVDTADAIGTAYSTEQTRAYLRKMAEGRAHATNVATHRKLVNAQLSEEEDTDAASEIFERREEVEAPMLGRSLATATAGWATIEACSQAKGSGFTRTILKIWVTGTSPRPTHAMMDGQTVPYKSNFSNGAYWPGDDDLSAQETCGCNCSVDVLITD